MAGEGVGRDMVAAYRWLEIATRLDAPGAGRALSPDEIALAGAEAEGWLAEH